MDGGEGGFFASPTSVPISAIIDGTSNTIASSRTAAGSIRTRCRQRSRTRERRGTTATRTSTRTARAVVHVDAGLPRDSIANPSGNEPIAVWRWADQDACGSGISGPANSSAVGLNPNDFDSAGNYIGKVINQNAYPIGGPVASTGKGIWTYNNEGLNDEPFSFHPGGCNSVFVDGSVHFLADSLDAITLRYLVTRAEGKSTTTAF